jgi:hypothetical protein
VKASGKSDSQGSFVIQWTDGAVNLKDELMVEVATNPFYKSLNSSVTVETANYEKVVALEDINDLAITVKIAMDVCNLSTVVISDLQKSPLFTDSTKSCEITFKNSKSSGKKLEIG